MRAFPDMLCPVVRNAQLDTETFYLSWGLANTKGPIPSTASLQAAS